MSAFAFATPRPTRRPSLTPMIDVVFLLLVFFMLAARFGQDGAIVLSPADAGAAAEWHGPPRLITLSQTDLRLNGTVVLQGELATAIRPLMEKPSDPIVIRAVPGTPLHVLVALLDTLAAAGLSGAVLVE